jgi:uncharacterized caspase-like protein
MTPFKINRRDYLALGLAGMAYSATSWANTNIHTAPSLSATDPKGTRMALVIGNAKYEHRPLRHAAKDANLVATSLVELGYQVHPLKDASLVEMLEAMKTFWLNSRSADARVIFYAGHAVVHDSRNYLLPIDAKINSAAEVPRMAAELNAFTDKLAEAKRGVNVVILDACRTSLSNKSGSRAIPSGLEPVVAPRGTLVAFSTAPGAVALDGNEGNSPYSRHLMEQLKVPGQPIEQMFKRVRDAVAKETDEQQVPWENSSLRGDFCFRNGPSGLCPTKG